MANNIETVKIAVIGGSGITEIGGIENVKEFEIDTPFGKPSSPITVGNWMVLELLFCKDMVKVMSLLLQM